MKTTSLLEMPSSNTWTFMLYGLAGSGKTICAGRSQKYKTLVIDCDNSTKSLQRFLENEKAEKFPQVYSITDTNESFRGFVTDWKEILSSDFELVVLDTFSEYQRKYLRYVSGHGNMITQQNYGTMLTHLEDLLTGMRESNKHFVFTAHEKRFVSSDGSDVYSPSLAGQIETLYTKHFDCIGRFRTRLSKEKGTDKGEFIDVVQRYIDFDLNVSYITKDRSFNLHREEPNIDTLLEKVMKEKN
jgi:phage nucleotide-binding protein